MTTSLKARFREVDAVPTPWDDRASAATYEVRPLSGTRPRRIAVAVLAAAAAAAIALTLVVVSRDGAPLGGDASWLMDPAQAQRCVEQYSPATLEHRSYAFEGVISDVQGPADPDSPDPADLTTTITFDVVRWFWGGSGSEASRRTYALASSAGELDGSVGARLLVSGDEDYIWACGFTQPATEQGRSEFEAAAATRGA
jgi:hypothetical protein